MTDWYAPNQQAVGTDPAAGGAEPKKAEKAETKEPEPKATSTAKAKGKD